jgi:hypothetical protein
LARRLDFFPQRSRLSLGSRDPWVGPGKSGEFSDRGLGRFLQNFWRRLIIQPLPTNLAFSVAAMRAVPEKVYKVLEPFPPKITHRTKTSVVVSTAMVNITYPP